MLKYHVMLISDDYTVNILYTSFSKPDCHHFVNDLVKDKYQVDGSYTKAYFDDDCVTIYNFHYIMPKTLKCKILIAHYTDIPVAD